MYPSIKLMNNFKNSLQELGFRKKVKYIHSIRSSINTPLDCKTVGFFLKISKEIGKARRKSLTRAKRASPTPDLLFDCSCVLEYAKIRTVLQSNTLVENLLQH